MTVQFMEPLNLAWNRMKIALFKPFDIHKWVVVGFNAFLAGLMQATNGGSGARFGRHGNFADVIHFPHTAWQWLQGHPLWAAAIAFGLLVSIAVFVALTWVSARGTFMFVDNVVRDTVEIAKPWRDYQKEGNSLFVWRLLLGVGAFITFGAVLAVFFARGVVLYEEGINPVLPIGFLIGTGLAVLALVIIWGYIHLFLRDFVAALMYRDRISCGQAWKIFLGVFGKAPLQFTGDGILIFLFVIAYVIAAVIAGFATCCIGFFFLFFPYVSSVVTLPVWYTYRGFSLEFLAQFGPEYDAYKRQGQGAAPAVPAAPAV